MTRRSGLLVLGGLLLAGAGLFAEDAPVLHEASYPRWRSYIAPAPAELQWQEIPWRSQLWGALLEANREQKPILLWAMNGHPLACT